MALASVRDTFEDELYGPAWVLLARGVCLRDAKGELVSDARGSDPNDLECTDATIWILAGRPRDAATRSWPSPPTTRAASGGPTPAT